VSIDKTLFERLGGRGVFVKVHKIFYDKLFADEWLGKYMEGKIQDLLEDQQTDFMVSIMGGPNRFAGKTPKWAHSHMVITDELFSLRHQLLSESIKEAGVGDALREEWLAVDDTFRRALVKSTEEKCVKAYPTQPILNYPKP